jgi:hypothetical protein
VWQRRERGREPDLGWLDRRLGDIGFRLVLCSRRPESFAAARARRLEISGNPTQYDDLELFVREQQEFRAAAESSCLERLELDVSDDDVAAAADRIADWLQATGGLTGGS